MKKGVGKKRLERWGNRETDTERAKYKTIL